MKRFSIGKVRFGEGRPLLIAGPCVIEGREMLSETAGCLREIAEEIGWPLVFKGSLRKENRLAVGSYRGLESEDALALLGDVSRAEGLPCLTDIHEASEAAPAAAVVDCLQIPAFLCRQSPLLEAAGATGKPVNIKKGQFLSAEDMAFSAEKVAAAGNDKIMLTERGTSFGYRDLVVDFRSFPLMAGSGHPVIFDLTHSQQRPGAGGGKTAGSREFCTPFARAALALGIDGFFIEVHPDPEKAMSDASTQLNFDQARSLLRNLETLRAAMEAGDALP